MDKDNPAEQYERKSKKYLRYVEKSFGFNPSTGLHQPKSTIAQNESQKDGSSHVEDHLPFKPIRPNWADILQGLGAIIGIPIGFLTLLLLLLTVRWAHKQWEAANTNAKAAICAAQAAQAYAQTAHMTFEAEDRPWLSLRSPQTQGIRPPSAQGDGRLYFEGFNATLVNSGRTPALRIKKYVLATVRGPTTKSASFKIPTYDQALADQKRWEAEERTKHVLPPYETFSPFWEQGNSNIAIAPNDARPISIWDMNISFPIWFRLKGNLHTLSNTVFILGKLVYSDTTSKETHTTDFCFLSNGQSFDFCGTGNGMK